MTTLAGTQQNTVPKPSRARSRAYPTISLRSSVEFAGKIRRVMAYKAFSRKQLEAAFGISKRSGSFESSTSAVAQYGLIEGRGNDTIVTALARRILDPISESDRQSALQEAFARPELHRELINHYNGERLPDQLGNVLLATYGIQPAAKEACARLFRDSAAYAGVLDASGILRVPGSVAGKSAEAESDLDISSEPESGSTMPTLRPQKSSKEGVQTIVLELDEGRSAQLVLPSQLTTDDIELLETQFKVFKLQAERNAKKQRANPEVEQAPRPEQESQ